MPILVKGLDSVFSVRLSLRQYPIFVTVVCDDCNTIYHGDCPVHGPLPELNPTAGYDQASLAYTQLPVPAQLTVKPSVIRGAGLGVFSTTLIKKGVRVGPYEGKKVQRSDMGDLYNTAYAWEVSSARRCRYELRYQRIWNSHQ